MLKFLYIFFSVLNIFFLFTISSYGGNKISTRYADTVRIHSDLIQIITANKFRNYQNTKALNNVAEYIKDELLKTCDTVYFQTYLVNGESYKNVIGSIGINNKKRIIVGAHYDVCGLQDGADDNATGVVGLLELSRLLKNDKLNYRIDFVAYTLEEPPFFRTENMGSFVHAKSLKEENAHVLGMICLEMLGYFSDAPNSQTYPLGIFKLFYGSIGNYITVVQKYFNGKFGRKVKRKMKHQKLIKTKSFKGPSFIPGIDFSDHQNYWKFGYSAVMITNTAFYRNKNYHKKSDKIETLNLSKMGLVIDEVYLTLKNW